MKILFSLTAVAVLTFVFGASFALAAPAEKTAAFVCPVIENTAVGNHNPVAKPLGDTGAYTVVQGKSTHEMVVPIIATNGDGTHSPGDPDQSGPGDTDYTAIWAK